MREVFIVNPLDKLEKLYLLKNGRRFGRISSISGVTYTLPLVPMFAFKNSTQQNKQKVDTHLSLT